MVVLVAANNPPVADAGADRAGEPGLAVLDGTDSHDPDGVDRLRYAWKQISGPPVELQDADTARPSFACDVEGQYAFELVVSDGFVDSPPSRTKIVAVGVTKSLRTKNIAPAAGASFYPDISGGKAVYITGLSLVSWQIACKDLNMGVAETFTAGGMNMQPKIDGDLVVWSGGASSRPPSGPSAQGLRPKCQHRLPAGTAGPQ